MNNTPALNEIIDKLIKEEIKSDMDIWIEFKKDITASFLNTIGELYERTGYEAANAYLLNQVERDRSESEILMLKKILDKIYSHEEIYKTFSTRAIGRYIFVALNSIRKDVLKERKKIQTKENNKSLFNSPIINEGEKNDRVKKL